MSASPSTTFSAFEVLPSTNQVLKHSESAFFHAFCSVKSTNSSTPSTNSSTPGSTFYTKEWANEKLRFAIATLQGKIESSIWKRRLQTALIVRDELLEHGFKWQAERIDNWIHRLQPKADLIERERGAFLNGNRSGTV